MSKILSSEETPAAAESSPDITGNLVGLMIIIVFSLMSLILIVAGLIAFKRRYCLSPPDDSNYYSETPDVENQKEAQLESNTEGKESKCPVTWSIYDNFILRSPACSILPNGYELKGTIIRRDGSLLRQALDPFKRQVMLKLGSSYEEFRILSNFSHPNIIEFYGAFQYEETTILVLEWTPRSLKTILNSTKLEIESVIFIAKEVSNALVFLHSKGIAFCNLKAKNVVQSYSSSNRFKLSGFSSTCFDVTSTHRDIIDFGKLLLDCLQQ